MMRPPGTLQQADAKCPRRRRRLPTETNPALETIFIELMTSDRKLKASREAQDEGSTLCLVVLTETLHYV